ncbi:hypothetical protein IG631_21210 [Alternaria alternata]|nr:hypothetical protein IG631_21210 [Alternaria alternata]
MASESTTGNDQLVRDILDGFLAPVVEILEDTDDGDLPEEVRTFGRILKEFKLVFESKEIRLSTTGDELRENIGSHICPFLDYLKNYQENEAPHRNQLETSAAYLYRLAQVNIILSYEERKPLRQAYQSLVKDFNVGPQPKNAQHNKMGSGAKSNQFVARNQYNNSGHGFQMIGNIRNFNQGDGQGRTPST